jgi:hypothetical protein
LVPSLALRVSRARAFSKSGRLYTLIATWWGLMVWEETFTLQPYRFNMRAISRQASTMAPSETPSSTTKISLLGAWTRTPPGRRAAVAAPRLAGAALEPRVNG